MKKNKPVYLDYHATTPMDPRVGEAMKPFGTQTFGNPASFTHVYGRLAHKTVEQSRVTVARLINASSREIIFTSGATESNNLAIKGAARAYRSKGNHLVTAAVEHKSVLDPFKRLALEGFRVTVLPVDRRGFVDPQQVRKALTKKTILISVMMANNEVGTIQNVRRIGQLAGEKSVLFHCDATQAVGKIPVNVRALGADLMSFSAHKMYGPKGIGALYVRKSGVSVKLIPLLDGGGQEGGLRPGTLNVPGIVGFAKACEICRTQMTGEARRLRMLRDYLQKELLSQIPWAVVNGSRSWRLPHNLNISFPGLDSRALLEAMPGLALSAGSACTATSIEPSYVLKAMGVSEEIRRGSIRFGLGRFNTKADINQALRTVVRTVWYNACSRRGG